MWRDQRAINPSAIRQVDGVPFPDRLADSAPMPSRIIMGDVTFGAASAKAEGVMIGVAEVVEDGTSPIGTQPT